MTTLTTPDGPSEIINARRTESLDAPNILKLVQPTTEALFGRVNVVNLIEKAVLAVTLSNDRDEVLGHAAFFDYPNLSGVDPAAWESWMNQYYDCQKCTAMNSLFMHYFVAKAEYSHGCGREIIRTMFNAVPELHYCFLVVPKGVFPDSALADIFSQLEKVGKGPDGCVIFACYRHDHVPVLHVRAASVEDHDDLVPIFNRQSDMLKHTYGDYFLAELIEAQDDQMKCIVAEVEGTAVGFMSLVQDVNVELLNECFELGPFHGLRKPHPDDVAEPPKTPTPTPPPPAKQDSRPSSARSSASHTSTPRSSITSKKSGPRGSDKDLTGSSDRLGGPGSRAGSGSTNRGSQFSEDVKYKSKLSDGDESFLSDHSDLESVHSEASQRNLDNTLQEVQAPGPTEPVTPVSPSVKRFVPQYKGEVTAFCIQLFCVDERYDMRSCDFLAAAFELFPACDFCVITVPHLVPEFPLLQQFVRAKKHRIGIPLSVYKSGHCPEIRLHDFFRVTPRVPSTLGQELYVFSRAGLLRDFRVRLAGPQDVSGVENLVKSLELSDVLLKDLKQYNKAKRDDDGTELRAFVAECHSQVVGIAIVRREEDIEYIRSHYNIEDFVYFNHHRREEHAHLHHYALNPCFKLYCKHFLKEILRLGHKSCLYYPLYPAYADKNTLDRHTLVAALHDMVPVRARRQISYPLGDLAGNAPSDRVTREQEQYALNHINRKLTLEPKVTINARIVVVGASDVGVAFLETFAFCPHLRFNNLTLISPHGLPGELPPDAMRDGMLGDSMCYSQEEYAQMALRSWVNTVYGKMTAIDRKRKHVVVNYTTIVPYDHLVLATGAQYQLPAPTGADISTMATNAELPASPDRRLQDTAPPRNVFVVNDAYDAAVALYWLEKNVTDTDGAVVVYGASLDVYCCIQTLLSSGIAGDRIHLVEPPQGYQTTCFNNHDVEKAMSAEMAAAGVTVHCGYILAQWNDGDDCDEISCVSFTSDTKPLQLDAKALFAFYKKQVDYEAFKAINDSCLVYDGRLVIDAAFHTTDVSIRGAGPLTKYQRSYHADQWTHTNFNSKEVGLQLASAMLTLFDPTLEPEPEPPRDLLKLIPMYRSPKIHGGMLPGGYHYLQVAKPGLDTPLDVLMAQNDYGRALITGAPGDNTEYFRLHVNQYNTIETITCLSKQPFSHSNLTCLFGLHERYLNNLVSRFDEKLVTDFYSYFRQPWALAVFHDRFPDFRDEVRELLITRPMPDVEALEEKVRALIEEDLNITASQRRQLSETYLETGAKRAVETRLLSFLSYNYYHLPMYAKPGMV